MSRGYYGYGGFAPYVPVAVRKARAEKTCAAMIKKGVKLEPVKNVPLKIAKTWWGKAWTQNLERYADYSNRMPRGRTYVRNGSVVDLKISPNRVTAMVAGSSSEPYRIKVDIASLDATAEKKLLEKSRASLDSLHTLLSGEFPEDLKEEFFKQGSGLFPSPKEIKLDCSCPDSANMCKHVAASLYGVAVRLDEKPELFFTLRGINVADFIGEVVKQESTKILKKSATGSTRTLVTDDADISALFGITMDTEKRVPPVAKLVTKKKLRRATAKPVKKIPKR